MASKTARASAVKEVGKPKVVIPDGELIRLLRIDRAAGIYPGVQGTDAALRRIAELETALAEVTRQLDGQVELRNEDARQHVLATSTIATLRKTVNDMACVAGLSQEQVDSFTGVGSLPPDQA